MQTLAQTLMEYDLDLLRIIANRWDVDLLQDGARSAADQLTAVMLDAERASGEWARLDDRERRALQIVLGSHGHKMPLAQYTRLYGELRRMGPERRNRDKPHLAPEGMTEVLYYRGLIGVVYDQGKTGTQPFVYVPPDLAAVLPAHETGYEPDADSDDQPVFDLEPHEPAHIQKTDPSLVDDLTTLLAYMQIETLSFGEGFFSFPAREQIEAHFIGEKDPARLGLLIGLAHSMGLIVSGAEGSRPNPAGARQWLELPRSRQVHQLVEAWQNSISFDELAFIAGLRPEPGVWEHDPRLLRHMLEMFLGDTPPHAWLSVDELVSLIKEEDPDFQRSDYDGWYIRDVETGDYLNGFENWDMVEGVSIRFALTQVLFWLGLADRGTEDGQALIRLSAYGRAWSGVDAWPQVEDPETGILVDEDGRFYVSRHVSRYSRFQLARFTEWLSAGDRYEYRLSAAGFERAGAQGILPQHILTFLRRTSQETLPSSVETMVNNWGGRAQAPVTITRLVVLQAETAEVLQTILETPELRRFVGTVLGPTACTVRQGQWQVLQEELQRRGLLVELDLD